MRGDLPVGDEGVLCRSYDHEVAKRFIAQRNSMAILLPEVARPRQSEVKLNLSARGFQEVPTYVGPSLLETISQKRYPEAASRYAASGLTKAQLQIMYLLGLRSPRLRPVHALRDERR